MADVRSMLRSELASRKAPAETTSKKRKAATLDRVQESKKARANGTADEEKPTIPQDALNALGTQDETTPTPQEAPDADVAAEPTQAPVDEDEWAAFERDMATPPPDRQGVSALNAPATIEAQPLGAAELAAQAREAESNQRGQREAEIDDEREEAEARLLDQFEEMDALEERVRKLREKREAIRRGSRAQSDPDPPPAATLTEQKDAVGEGSASEEDDDDDDDGEEWDVWGV